MRVQSALVSRFGAKAFKFRIGQLFPTFLQAKKAEVRASTYVGYLATWDRYFSKKLGKVYLGDFNQKVWSDFCEQLKKKTEVRDFQTHRNLMSHFLVWCLSKEFVMAVPKLKNPKHVRRKRKIVPPEHLVLIFQRAHGRLLLFLTLALFMGMRRDEIMGLDWARIDLKNRSLTLSDSDVKTGDGRHLPMSVIVHSLLVARLKELQDEGLATKWVFPHAKSPKKRASAGSLMTAWRRCLLHCGLAERVKTVGNKSKYKIVVQYTWHDLRATFEKHAHKSLEHTDTQREKFAGAAIDVQKKIYVSMDAEDLRGLEEVVSKQVPEVARIIAGKTVARKVEVGNVVEIENLKTSDIGVNNENV